YVRRNAYNNTRTCSTFHYPGIKKDMGMVVLPYWKLDQELVKWNGEKHCYDHFDYENKEGISPEQALADGYTYEENLSVAAENTENVAGFLWQLEGNGVFINDADEWGNQVKERKTNLMYDGEGWIRGHTSQSQLVENYEGVSVAAVFLDGSVSVFTSPLKLSPITDRNMSCWSGSFREYGDIVSFPANEAAKDCGFWIDDMGTEEPGDDETVIDLGYSFYLNCRNAYYDDLQWIELWPECRTVSRNGEYISSFNKKDVLMFLYQWDLTDDSVTLPAGSYDLTVVCDEAGQYLSDTFEVDYKRSSDPGPEISPVWHSWDTWVKSVDDAGSSTGKRYDEFDRPWWMSDEEAKISANNAGFDIEMHRAEFCMPQAEGDHIIGYLVQTADGQVIREWDTLSANFTWGFYGQGYRMRPYDHTIISFLTPKDGGCDETAVVRAVYDDGRMSPAAHPESFHQYMIDTEPADDGIKFDTDENGRRWISWTPDEAVKDRIKYNEENKEYYFEGDNWGYDVFVSLAGGKQQAQEMNYNWCLDISANRIRADFDEIIMDMTERSVFDPGSGVISGNYTVTAVLWPPEGSGIDPKHSLTPLSFSFSAGEQDSTRSSFPMTWQLGREYVSEDFYEENGEARDRWIYLSDYYDESCAEKERTSGA
ncbi:MAG: hypothetical protein IK139_00680, partial [Lachnospiraceae bacterium]|nr:hypothetical protein [Lachnospiraceae bacterium]